jgi:hypothetical protein
LNKQVKVFLIINFFICIALLLFFLKMTIYAGIEIERFGPSIVQATVYILLTILLDLYILATIGLLKKKIITATIVEVFIFYVLLYVILEYVYLF